MNLTHLLVLCGGKSAEHEISLISGWNLCNKLKSSTEFSLTLITIDKNGKWFLQSVDEFLKQEPHPNKINYGSNDVPILLQAGEGSEKFYHIKKENFLAPIDVVFPLLHGPNGEDGSMQGLLQQLQIPYIGPKVLASAVCMDKDFAKRLMQQAGIPTSKFVSFSEEEIPDFNQLVNQLGLPLFVKPANMGSSVGISKVRNQEEYFKAIEEAFRHDKKIIIEEFVEGIELECAVLGNEELIVSRPGRYVYEDDFFEFETKYLKPSKMQIPASGLSTQQQQEVMDLSKEVYKALGCVGMARVDTFFTNDGRFLVNEVNTLPGFTKNSMYPVLIEDKGIAYADLIKKLCELTLL